MRQAIRTGFIRSRFTLRLRSCDLVAFCIGSPFVVKAASAVRLVPEDDEVDDGFDTPALAVYAGAEHFIGGAAALDIQPAACENSKHGLSPWDCEGTVPSYYTAP